MVGMKPQGMRYQTNQNTGHSLLELQPLDFWQPCRTMLSGFLGVEIFEKDSYVDGL